MKVFSISLFFFFCVILGNLLNNSMGWASTDKNLPSIITIRSVVIKEPNVMMNSKGSIYLWLEYSTKTDSILLDMFGHKTEGTEPRAFKLPYSRSFHEQLQKNVIPKLMKGQSVTGKFSKRKGGSGFGAGVGEEGDFEGDGNGTGHGGKGGKRGLGGQGRGGSDSLSDEFRFYELPPSYFLRKT